jgi:serine phosphatase RsbU (regulator of sigma subunit)
VGGDFFQILPIPGVDVAHPERGQAAFIVLGDVSGKGLKAAMTVSMIVGTLRTSARHCAGPGELLGEVNRSMIGRSDGFATCIALKVEASGRVTVANAGHPNLYCGGKEIETESNLPLGLVAKITYPEISLELRHDQICTLVTDGVVESTSAKTRELFGFGRTEAMSTQPAAEIARTARQFGEGAPQADDITVLSIALGQQPVAAIA